MKKYITLLLLIAAIGANAQVVTRVKSKALADSIWIIKGAYEITPIIVTSTGDTARTIDYVLHLQRDTSATVVLEVRFYDKVCTKLNTLYENVPESAYTKWSTLINKIDAYISNLTKRIVKQ